MINLRIAIVDDVSSDREQIKDDVCRWAEERQAALDSPPALFQNGEEFLAGFCADLYDIIFLDIYMDGIDGMATARRIREIDTVCRLIFITTTADFAVDSYEVDSSWYLVKPYSADKLNAALDRCGSLFLEAEKFITVPAKYGEQRLRLHDIAYTEYENRKIHVYFKDGCETFVPMKQGDFAAMLLAYPYFCDCMKGLLVNFEAVDKLLEDSFLLHGGCRIPISRLKYREVRERFFEFSYAQARGRQFD